MEPVLLKSTKAHLELLVRVIVIGGVACGSLACTFALGFLFVCFNKRERRSPEKDCLSTSMSSTATVI